MISLSPPGPTPCEEGMPRQDTILNAMEQAELFQPVQIIVPQGIGSDGRVQFLHAGKRTEACIPDGMNRIGQQVTVVVQKRPPLERNQTVLQRRGRFPGQQVMDRYTINDTLRHGGRVSEEEDPHNILSSVPMLQRCEYYRMIRGGSMDPVLAFVPEETEDMEDPLSPLRS